MLVFLVKLVAAIFADEYFGEDRKVRSGETYKLGANSSNFSLCFDQGKTLFYMEPKTSAAIAAEVATAYAGSGISTTVSGSTVTFCYPPD